MKAAVLLTCFNRKEKTINCIERLSDGNKADIDFVVVDDGSSDGTCAAIKEMDLSRACGTRNIVILEGNGNLFYSGGMRKAMEYAKDNIKADYYILVNDDVIFDAGVIDELEKLDKHKVLVGAMRNSKEECSYGGIRYVKRIHYETVKPSDIDRRCDTFNANFVAVPAKVFEAVPVMDEHYKHSLGDFDYGMSIKKGGYALEVLDHFVGICESNSSQGTWRDKKLSRRERIKQKESVKGAPAAQWYYFLKKNFGLFYALIYSVTPYIRILFGA